MVIKSLQVGTAGQYYSPPLEGHHLMKAEYKDQKFMDMAEVQEVDRSSLPDV